MASTARIAVWVLRLGSFVAVAGMGTLAALSCRGGDPAANALSLRGELVSLVGDAPRPAQARLSGEFAPAPYRPGRLVSPADGEGFQRLMLRIHRAAERGDSAQALADSGVLQLLVARPGRAVAELARAIRRAPADPRHRSDLAAAHLAAWQAGGGAHELLAALQAAESACAADPHLPEARYNFALLLERFSLPAERAWREYLALDCCSGWARRAREHLANLSGPGEAELWGAAIPRLERAALAGDAAEVGRIVDRFRMRARKFGEAALLARWAGELMAGRPESAAQALQIARAVGSEVYRLSSDRMLLDAVAAIERAGPADPLIAQLAAGQLDYARGLRAYDRFDVATAQGAFRRASERLKRGGSPLALTARAMLAACDYQDNRYEAAAAALDRLARSVDATTYPNLAARILWSRGVLAIIRSRYEDALADYRRSLALFLRTGERENAANLRDLIYEYFYFVGDWQQGWDELLPALREVPSMDDPRRQYAILEGGAAAALAAGSPGLALLFEDEALRWAQRTGHPAVIASALRWRATYRAKAGLRKPALEDAAEAVRKAAEVASPGLRAGLLADVLLVDGELAEASEPQRAITSLTRAIVLHRQTDNHLQVVRALQARARTYRALGELARSEGDLLEGVREIERQRLRVGRGQRASFLDGAQDLFSDLAALELDFHRRPDRAYSFSEQSQARVLLDLTGGEGEAGRLPTLSEVQRGLPAGVILVQYAPREERLLAWAISSAGSDFAQIEIRQSRLAEAVEKFRAGASGRDAAGADEVGRKLYRLLLGPFLRQVAASKAVIFVPGGALQRVPFAALKNPASGKFLIEELAVGAAPSARSYLRGLRRLHSQPVGPAARALLLGDPAPDRGLFPGLARLPAAAREVTEIARLYHGPQVLIGAQASKEAFLREAGEHDLLHLGAHAFDHPQRPEMSRLVLAPSGADSGVLYASELYRQTLVRPRLAVLAACASGNGALSATEGTLSLAHAFLAAGVPQVIAALWPVGDGEALAFSRAFYRELSAGASPLAALRRAQVAMIHSGNPELAAPAAWAAFESMGSARP